MITELKFLYTHTCSVMLVGFENGLEVPIKETDIPQPVLDAVQAWNASQQVKTVEPEPNPDPVDDSAPVANLFGKGSRSKQVASDPVTPPADPVVPPVEPTVSG